VGQVVDVLAGAGEVDELADLGQLRQLGGLLLEQVFDGLDVVVGGALDLLDALGVLQLEVLARLSSRALASAENAGTSPICGWAARRWSQRTSTRTRKRIRPNSLKMGRRAWVLPA
jgi:hypothetical protein